MLDLAIRGKLTEQLPSDGTAEELYQQIQADKQRLIKEGKIKKEKPLPEISSDEIPFEIPSNWKWARLGNVGSWSAGSTPSRREPAYYNGTIPWLKTGDLNDSFIKNVSECISEKALAECSLRMNPIGSVLIAMYGATIGKLGILNIPVTTNQACCACITYKGIDNLFLFYYLLYERDKFIDKGHGGAQPNISKEIIVSSLIPLPPIAEQKRIVERVEEIFRLLDTIDQAQEKYSAYAESLKAKLYSIALQGKLTEQLDSDGTATMLYHNIQAQKYELAKKGELYREKPIKKITNADIPYPIPDSWLWVRLGELTKVVTKGSSPKWQGVSYTDEDKGILFITSENVGNGKMLLGKRKYVQKQFNDIHPSSILRKGDILTNIVGASIGRTAIFDEETDSANTNQAVCIVRLINQDMSDYILRYLCSKDAIRLMLGKVVDTARANLSLTSVSNLMIPLPPLAEQKRIAEVLERVLGALSLQ